MLRNVGRMAGRAGEALGGTRGITRRAADTGIMGAGARGGNVPGQNIIDTARMGAETTPPSPRVGMMGNKIVEDSLRNSPNPYNPNRIRSNRSL